ncbi:hypothetical protein Leryth_025300 [Lithospermum erythrorhizon]|nr:hypothetical protein Leryth_025300 [Lithospermum erythrorhizon]
MRGPLMPTEKNSLFFVNVSIGEPPLPQLLVIDTGSDLSWVQCIPCSGCHEAVHPTYNPTKSSSFTSISCDSESCEKMRLISWIPCESWDGKCLYDAEYEDGAGSRGDLAYEKFTFTSSDDGIIELPRAIFGCGRHVNEPLWQSSGMLGLGYSMRSMLFQSNSSRFSYCLGNISDPTYQYNKLIIGDGAILQGDSIPLSSDKSDNYYYIRADGINVGEKHIEINEQLDFMLDSGTTLIHLMKDPLDALKKEVRGLMEGLLAEHHVEGFLCYRGDMRRDLTGFPTITLSLSGGANLQLDVEGAFWYPGNYNNRQVFCLAFAEAKNNRNVIGVIAQQYYNIGFDLENWNVSLQRIDCQLFED